MSLKNDHIKDEILLTKKEHENYKHYIDKLWGKKLIDITSVIRDKETITKVEYDTEVDTFMRYYELRAKGMTLDLKDDKVCIEDKVKLMGFSCKQMFGKRVVELIDYYFDNKKLN